MAMKKLKTEILTRYAYINSELVREAVKKQYFL